MGKSFALVIILLSILLLLVLQNLEVVNAVGCTGSFYNENSTYVQNRDDIFSTLPDKVIANGGFYNASLGNSPNRVYALVLCQRGYEQQDCFNCVLSATRGIKKDCPTRMNSYTWDKDVEDNVSCLVRSSIHSTFGNLELEPAVLYPSPDGIDPSKNMTLFEQEWDGMVNRTVEAATGAETSSVLKYHGAIEAEFTEFENVYMLMQCTPDITSQDCNRCLRECVTLFINQLWGRRGGEVNRPSCFFRWDFYTFHGAFGNVTRLPSPPAQEKGSSATEKKGRSTRSWVTIAIFVVLTFINVFVSIGLIKFFARRRKSNNGINVDSEEHSESDGQHMLRFNLGMILTATNNFSSENKLGQGGFGTVHKGILPNGQEIAVKRLTKGSGQGDTEFKNEVSLLTRLQHRNLVKLLGFCSEGDEEILVYELVHNSSLDHFIFDEERRSLLSWELRFRIIEGIARGLLYLHEDSQLKIIHRDLKASNILKISAKSDVYSFGVMLLEMISGERNNSFEGEGLEAFLSFCPEFSFIFKPLCTECKTYIFLVQAWKRWVEGKPETVIDPLLMKDPINEIMKLIQIGLLCVQENAAKRPTMRLVIVWFGSDTIIIPLPKAPAMSGSQSQSEDGTMSMRYDSTELSCR
uniref:non-specific serine/threonine protein kinase n=1 Tax=Brassica oleracea var. oleracea TaxID=109376 RepID=A0A0D3AUU7_BRAOL